jgi:UDP-N-acetylmuramyl pentapeptide phosphotransferase/UDP-N-acetylglucosamine-1-phosphate transferase
MSISDDLAIFLTPITAFVITYFSIPALIRLALLKKLYDTPDERKQHNLRISPLGGIAIFGGMLISFVFFSAGYVNPALNSILVALFILLVTGIKDDLYPLVPYKKFLGQLIAILIIMFQGDIRLESFYGLFGIWELPYIWSLLITGVFFLGIINSFNFIDGINGLSSGIGVVISTVYALWFYYLNEPLFLILSLSVAGSLLAFLPFNLFKARIFMGDSGSMVLGFLAALMTIYFLQANERSDNSYLLHIDAMVFAFAVLIIPVVDTFRVVLIRMFILKRSPFTADRNHIHHALIDIGMSHAASTGLLVAVNIVFVLLCYFLNDHIRASVLIILLSLLAIGLSQIPFVIKKRKKLVENRS